MGSAFYAWLNRRPKRWVHLDGIPLTQLSVYLLAVFFFQCGWLLRRHNVRWPPTICCRLCVSDLQRSQCRDLDIILRKAGQHLDRFAVSPPVLQSQDQHQPCAMGCVPYASGAAKRPGQRSICSDSYPYCSLPVLRLFRHLHPQHGKGVISPQNRVGTGSQHPEDARSGHE
jgi:hypothetical protein